MKLNTVYAILLGWFAWRAHFYANRQTWMFCSALNRCIPPGIRSFSSRSEGAGIVTFLIWNPCLTVWRFVQRRKAHLCWWAVFMLSSGELFFHFADLCTAFKFYEDFIQENTPGIYSDEDYHYFQMRMILKMLEIWENPNQCSSDAMDEIRAKLKERRKDAGVYLLPPKTRIKIRMICYCPTLLHVMKPTFRLFRKIYRFIFKSFVYLWL